MDNQELTEAEIDEQRWEIFYKSLELNIGQDLAVRDSKAADS
jgi:hypothetical protein